MYINTCRWFLCRNHSRYHVHHLIVSTIQTCTQHDTYHKRKGVLRLYILIRGTERNSCANTHMSRTLDVSVNVCCVATGNRDRSRTDTYKTIFIWRHITLGTVIAEGTLPESTWAAWHCSDLQWRSARRLWCSQCPPCAPWRVGSQSPNSLCSSACCRARAPDALWNPWISDPCGRASRKTLESRRCWKRQDTPVLDTQLDPK